MHVVVHPEPLASNKGWPCRDQIGRGADRSSQPFYEWDNLLDGADADVTVFNTWDGCDDPQPSDHVKPERDYFNDTPRPGYLPYPYPHPIAAVD